MTPCISRGCADCRFAQWERTKTGRIMRKVAGQCTWVWTPPPLPRSLELLGPFRRAIWPDYRDCPTWEPLVSMTPRTDTPLPAFPIRAIGLRGYWARRGYCPECGGDLDTGWECNMCGYDAAREAKPEWTMEQYQ